MAWSRLGAWAVEKIWRGAKVEGEYEIKDGSEVAGIDWQPYEDLSNYEDEDGSCGTTPVGTCILHPFLVLFTRLIPLILLLFHLFPVSIIVISVIYYDISGCSYSHSSTRIFITHLVHMLLFTPLFLYATLFHT